MDPINWSYLPDTAVVNILSHLSHRDRAQASSTCKRWRDSYFHPSFWRQVDATLSIKTGCEPVRCVLEKCGKFVHELTLIVVVADHRNVCGQSLGDRLDSLPSMTGSEEASDGVIAQPDDLPKYKTFYQELPSILDGLCGSRGLEKLIFSFFPQSEHCKCQLSPGKEFLSKMTENVRKVVQGSSKLKSLALGHSIGSTSQCKFLEELSERFGKQLEVLHIPAFQGAGKLSEEIFTSSLSKLKSLSVLTLNAAFVTNQVLESLSSSQSPSPLRHLNVVTGYEAGFFIWTGDACWEKLSRCRPDIRVSMSILIQDDAMAYDFLQYLTPSIPLASLRIFINHPNYLNPELVEEVAKNYSESLTRLELHTNKATTLFGNESEADPLVMLCWKCKKLNHIVITGYRVLACNILAIALLRGSSLATLEVERDLIYFYEDLPEEEDDETPTSYDSLHSDSLTSEAEDRFVYQMEEKISEISKSLKRTWRPMERQHMSLQRFLSQDLHICADE